MAELAHQTAHKNEQARKGQEAEQSQMSRRLLTLREVAAHLSAVRVGRQVRVDSEQLAAWIAGGGRALPGGWRQRERR